MFNKIHGKYKMAFNLDVLKIDAKKEMDRISRFTLEHVRGVFRRKGIVVGLSGGIDSACMAAIAVDTVGKERVVGLILPEKESNPVSAEFATKHAEKLCIEYRQIDISSTVDSVMGYAVRDEYIQKLSGVHNIKCTINY